ncbi:hypothetical protein EJC49_17380 [Aquibium carbonis]|uniref:Uncharacterized protein n=1 Tax=Aquibium carbonis TaxID=2495581 RepID=A0A429YUK5_9HYPH|nr:hypothetical protein [Aquibium carbonis]RST85115.1 hypothetical protein EJC49_17380 [Aquibium carbonis]
MSRDARKEAAKAPARKTEAPLSDVPDAGAMGEKAIRPIDLEPRSNGENDWQDERPAQKRPASDI